MENVENPVRREGAPVWKVTTWVGGLVALLVLGVPAALAWAGLSAMAGDVCPPNDAPGPPICSPPLEELVPGLPLIALGAGLLVGLVGGWLAIRRRRSPLVWLGVAWTLWLISFLVANALATT